MWRAALLRTVPRSPPQKTFHISAPADVTHRPATDPIREAIDEAHHTGWALSSALSQLLREAGCMRDPSFWWATCQPHSTYPSHLSDGAKGTEPTLAMRLLEGRGESSPPRAISQLLASVRASERTLSQLLRCRQQAAAALLAPAHAAQDGFDVFDL